MRGAAKEADVVVMAAAPADFTPADASDTKIKKSPATTACGSSWCRPPTCWRGWWRPAPTRPGAGRLRRGDADRASTSLLELGRAKLARKGCDLLVLNEVGRGLVFGQPDNEITLLDRTERTPDRSPGRKDTLAHHIWDEALQLARRRVE